MGLLDFLFKRKNKVPMLTVGEVDNLYKKTVSNKIQEEEKIEDTIKVKVFGKKEATNMVYTLEVHGNNGNEIIGRIVSAQDDISKETYLKKIIEQIEGACEPITTASNPYRLDKAKKNAIEKLKDMSDRFSKFSIDTKGIKYIEEYQLGNVIDYNELERLPRNIDIKNLPEKDVIKYGKLIQRRINTLDEINTPDAAYEDRENLVYYMQQQEDVPTSSLIDANIQNVAEEGEALDEKTILKIARNMEPLNNEDGALYSVYLKLEEKRVWKKIESTLNEYLENSEDMSQVSEAFTKTFLLKDLSDYEIKDVSKEFSYNSVTTIMKQMNKRNIEYYMNNIKEKDMCLVMAINGCKTEVPDRAKMLQFLYARMGSLGQVSYKSKLDKKELLRNFVDDTDFKHEDNTESKEFLLLVSKIEREYLQNEYGKILDYYREKEGKGTQEKSFKERIGVDYTPTISSEQSNEQDRESKQMTIE